MEIFGFSINPFGKMSFSFKKLYSSIFLLISFSLGAQNCSLDSLRIEAIDANATDTEINPEIQNHQVFINTDCNQNGQLLIHLVGSFDNPANTTLFPTHAANNGFKVIVLKYPNLVAAFGTCSSSTDIDCYDNYRQEIVFGEDVSTDVNVNTANSILNRIQKLLIFLTENYPNEEWDNFLNVSDEIDWTNIILSGHSQGGGHAAYIAKFFNLKRIIQFASPNDYSTLFSAPAPWTNIPSVTADSLYYAFGNLFDEVVDFEFQYDIWQNLGMLNFGDSVNVDLSNCPFENSRVLYTRDTSSSNPFSGNHGSVVTDNETPIVNNVPVFTEVWDYLLGLCDIVPNVPSIDKFPSIKIFPIPSNGLFHVQNHSIIEQVNICDLNGRLIKNLNPNKSDFEFNLDEKGSFLFEYTEKNASKKHSQIIQVK